jgi:hypothetical protein
MPGPKDLDPSSSPRALLGAELRHAREKAGLSQEDLGQAILLFVFLIDPKAYTSLLVMADQSNCLRIRTFYQCH